MEKRFLVFVIIAMAILLGYQALEMRLNPRPAPPAVEDILAQDDAVPDGDEPTEADLGADTDAAEAPPVEVTAEVEPADMTPPTTGGDEQAEAEAQLRAMANEECTTIGSLDPNRPDKMLVWFTNQGAAIECIALNDPRYTDLDFRHGYLGYLALRNTADGCRIGAVGHGTPAFDALPASGNQPTGLQAGDILQQIDETLIDSSGDFLDWIEKTQPGQKVRILVRRADNDQWSTVEYTATLMRRPLEIIHPEPDRPSATEPQDPLSYLFTLNRLGDKAINSVADELAGIPSLKRDNWEMRSIQEEGQTGVEFQFVLTPAQLAPFGLSGPLRITRRFLLGQPAGDGETPNDGFHLNYEVIFRNEATDGPPIQLAYQQDGPNGLPLEGWWYTYKTHPRSFGGAGVRDIVFKFADRRHEMFTNPKIVARLDEPNPMEPLINPPLEKPLLEYIGVDSQYFTSTLLPDPIDVKAEPEKYRLAEAFALAIGVKDPIKSSRTNVSFRTISPVQSIEPNTESRQRFVIFAGPKHPEVLKQYGLQECITYGWFRVVAKPLTWVLHAFHTIFRNYGIAIILLTVLVRGCMFPLGRQQVMNAQKMQELAPEMRRIADQYKNDMEKRAEAQRELFRKHNYNPMAGCLPMFFQLPIFVGLYRSLSVDIELRQAPLIPGLNWCSNLAGPDQLMYWESFSFMPSMLTSPTGWLGPYLNILPLISVAFMMMHQKMFTPPPTDEQQEMQQRMMKFMMLFFALMFFRVPAGLCLYFITSSAWGLAERKLLPKSKSSASPDGNIATRLIKKSMPANGTGTGGAKKRSKSKRR